MTTEWKRNFRGASKKGKRPVRRPCGHPGERRGNRLKNTENSVICITTKARYKNQ